MWEVGALVEEDKVLMLCRQWRGSELVKGACEHEYPPGLESLRWYSWLVSCCSDGDWQVRRPDDASLGERPWRWYLRWFRWAVIPTDAGLAERLLSSLSRCLVSVAVDVAGRGKRAYRGAKADTRGTVVTS